MANRIIYARFYAYLEALFKLYTEANGKLLPWPKIKERLEICRGCEHFTGKKCSLCGCCTGAKESHFNKLAFPTERCPREPPLWEQEDAA